MLFHAYFYQGIVTSFTLTTFPQSQVWVGELYVAVDLAADYILASGWAYHVHCKQVEPRQSSDSKLRRE
jgi:hypothetical protein